MVEAWQSFSPHEPSTGVLRHIEATARGEQAGHASEGEQTESVGRSGG